MLSVLFVTAYGCYRLIDWYIEDGGSLQDVGPIAIGGACFLSAFPIPTLFTASCIAAGFVLGFGPGATLAIPSVLGGMLLCFETFRRGAKELSVAYVAKYMPDLLSLTNRHPRKSIILARLLPIPFSFQNLFWASCTEVTRREFFVFSSTIVVPHVVMMVYIGATSKSMSEAVKRRPSAALPMALGLSAVLVLWAVASRWARRVAAEAPPEETVYTV